VFVWHKTKRTGGFVRDRFLLGVVSCEGGLDFAMGGPLLCVYACICICVSITFAGIRVDDTEDTEEW
jgi:hypothetical protein